MSNSQSVWMHFNKPLKKTSLNQDISTEVAIVGAGIVGLTTAYLLSKKKIPVVLIDQGDIAMGESSRTTAHITEVLDDRYYHLESLYGIQGVKLLADSHSKAIERIQTIVKDENIQCDFKFVDGILFLDAKTEKETLENELKACHRTGIKNAKKVSNIYFGSKQIGPILHFPNQAQFNPMKYFEGLAETITQLGGKIYTDTHIQNIQSGESPFCETKSGYKIKAKSIVVATNVPINDRVMMHTKIASYRTYVIGVRIPEGLIEHKLYWDTADPYHYIRVFKPIDTPYEILIVGGEDHKSGQAELNAESHMSDAYGRLELWLKNTFSIDESSIFKWSGQIIEPIDRIAFIGRNPNEKNIYISTGDSGNGMTYGTIAGMLISDLIQDIPNEWAGLYDPSRKTVKAAVQFVSENINVVGQYGDWLKTGESEPIKNLAQCSGAVYKKGLKPIAVYRDEQDKIHQFSAVCPHLGCIVRWNDSEKSWDCPCHGSRFNADGTVIHGPATSNLESFR